MPIDDDEVSFLEALGAELRALRESAALSRSALGALATLSETHIISIEAGARRTRRSTLERIVAAFAGVVDLTPTEELEVIGHLVNLAGPALAGESDFRWRVDARRARRERKSGRRHEANMRAALEMARDLTAAAIVEHDRTGKWPAWVRRRAS